MKNTYDILRGIDFLQTLTPETLTRITSLFKEIHCPKGTVLFKEDDLGDSFYVVKSGRIALTKRLKKSENITGELSYFAANDYFGELALLDDEPRSGTAIASEDTELLMIAKKDFLSVCKDFPEIMLSIVKTMSGRLRETNKRYVDMLDELIKQNKLAAIGTAASKIVHDIKNPITIIVLTAQLIERIFEGTSDFTGKIVDQVNKVNDLVKEILDFASGESQGLNLDEIFLKNFFRNLLEELEPILEVRSTTVTINNSVIKKVRIDAGKVNRVFVNLMRNAIDAFEGSPGVITVNSSLEGKTLTFVVEDNGPGIPEEYLDKIFDPFVTYKKSSGTGLGLAICKKIIIDHGGSITVANKEDGGARFVVTLPV